ncbi:serine/threonine-protein phosphatase 7 long form homolog isoform X1 [Coffea arabica]|uniref:Serine/threonine-protein phosphatase 7 long form homolog isoform X1 n=1 Tax=Coffea arabica TaxID=13443 RepID=A0ABM4V3P4_COFAR
MSYSDDILPSLPDYCKRGERIWRTRVPLIFWHIVEIHCPDRVMRQFGMRQKIPEPVDTNQGGLHQLDLSGYPGRNWAHFHRNWIGYWNERAGAQVPGVPATTFRPSNKYLEWYHSHTILYITPPIQQHAQVGQMLHGVSGQFEYLMDTMQRIGRQSHDALEHEGRFHPRLATIVDGAYGSMQYLQRFDRMVVGDFDSFNHNPPVAQ